MKSNLNYSEKEYKKIPNIDYDCYVSKDGKVWGTSKRYGKGKIYKQSNSHGYRVVSLSVNGKLISFKVHRLVATAFIPNPESKPYINHIDGNRSNNCVENLEWCTQKENVYHANNILHARKVTKKSQIASSKRGIANRKLSMEQAKEVRNLYFNKGVTVTELSRTYGVCRTQIRRLLDGKTYREEGTKWENMS